MCQLSKRNSQVARRRSRSNLQMAKVKETCKHGKISLEMPRIRLRLSGETSRERKEEEAIEVGAAVSRTSSQGGRLALSKRTQTSTYRIN